ncbi:zf-HC2 domain-containing protein [Nitratireductor sp. XY-223]|uniref:zf-HC2 domain-containing protein n=1 Tax=Nitratireductor sp. XY-223 TaxID=2561926 RepID=UPI0010A9B2B4|nr:zf-HC2 domain-containing protein [Nitratireductor sp. XY-223]
MTQERFSDETLMAFADGELPPEEREAVERALENDPALGERVAAFLDSRMRAQDALKPLLDEPVPEALAARVSGMIGEQSNVTAFRQRQAGAPARRWALPLAASVALVAGALGGYLAGISGPDTESGLRMADLSQPGIVTALNSVASGAETGLAAGERFRAIASYRDADNTLCREFEVDHADGSTVVAVACLPDGTWELQFTVVAQQNSSGYAPASSLEALDAYLSAVGAGAPMSAEEEEAALRSTD